MIDFAELHEQNHRIGELSHVYLYLARERSLCDSETACGLFFDYVEEVRGHLKRVDKLVKKRLLSCRDPWARNLARQLIADSALLKRNFALLVKRWAEPGRRHLRIADHEGFVDDTAELFLLVAERIQRETELLYPLLRRLSSGGKRAA
jgi:hypothetical protein